MAGHTNVVWRFWFCVLMCAFILSSSSLLLPSLLLWLPRAFDEKRRWFEWVPIQRKGEGHKGGYYFLSVRDSFASSLFLPFKSYPRALESASTLGCSLLHP